MPRSQKGHKFILCIIDEMTNYLIMVPIYHSRSEEVGEALIEHVISKFCAPDCIIMDQDSAFMATLMNYLFRKLNIKIMTVALYNHQSLQAEHGIKTLSQILTKHLLGQGRMWHKYLPLATFTHNMFNSPNLANHSPYELVFGRKPKLLLDLEMDPDVRVYRFVSLMRKEEENSERNFPWLDDKDKRKYMTDREILDKYVNLDNSCLTKVEKE